MIKKTVKKQSSLKAETLPGLERSKVIKQLRQIESLLSNSIEYAVIYLDKRGRIDGCNKIAETIYGFTVDEMFGQDASMQYKHCSNKFTGINAILNYVLQKGVWKGKMKCNTKKGKFNFHEIYIMLRIDAKSNHIGFKVISKLLLKNERIFKFQLSQEILRVKNKKLKTLNTQIQEIRLLKNEFLANMSHDLRTPLNGIIGFAEIMYDGKVGEVSYSHKECLQEILSNAQMLLLLINDTLDLAKIESGKMEFTPERIDLFASVNDVKNIFDKIMPEKYLKIELDINAELKVNIDPNKLKQVLYNLISNAFKHSHNGGIIKISARPESADYFRIEVRDFGSGIRKKDFSKLFVEFQQIESSSTKKYHGSGLALALTKRIVEAQGGEVGFESVFGKGSVFYITLPLDAPRGKYGYIKQDDDIASTKKAPTILIIENNSLARQELIHLLGLKGYNVIKANNIEEAIDTDKVSCADAIVLDFFTTDISKWKLLRAFRYKKSFQKASALLITGVVSQAESFWFKIHDFLVKPVDPKELVAALKWSGVTPYTKKLILIVDEKKHFNLHLKVLNEFGYQSIYESNLEKALLLVESKHPDVLILNPFIESKNLSGFDFLDRMRLTLRGRYTPILITTLEALDEDQQAHIKGIIQRVVLKKEGAGTSLIDEIIKQHPINEAYK